MFESAGKVAGWRGRWRLEVAESRVRCVGARGRAYGGHEHDHRSVEELVVRGDGGDGVAGAEITLGDGCEESGRWMGAVWRMIRIEERGAKERKDEMKIEWWSWVQTAGGSSRQ